MAYINSEVMIVKDNTIKAVYDSDLVMLLKKLYVFEDVVNGRCKCMFCNTTITLDTIDSIIPNEDEISFSCNSHACRIKLVEGMSN